MSGRTALDQYIETLQVLAREGDTDRTAVERERDAAHRAKLIDDFAHELAEEQRAVADANDELDHDRHVYGFSNAVRQVADLIDPLSASPARPDEEPTPPCQSPTCNLSLSACVCGNPYGKEPTP